jgi:hypothetical protein
MFSTGNLDYITVKYFILTVTIITIGRIEKRSYAIQNYVLYFPPIINPRTPPKENIDAKVPWPIAILSFGN